MRASTDTEVELKLEVDAGDADALLAAAPLSGAAPDERRQVSTYHDTPDGRLRAAGLSLRVRRDGDRFVQTIKADRTAAGLFARPEWERDLADDRPVLDGGTPVPALAPDAAAAVAPVFTVEVDRRRWLVEHEGAAVEVVLDRGRVTAGDRSAPVCEVELELKRGDPAALFSLARALDEAAPLRLGPLTKSERGYRLLGTADGRSVKAEPLAVAAEASVAAALAAVTTNCLRQFRFNEDLLRAGGGPDALHQARVALRRLRSALSIFRPVAGDDERDRLAAELRWLAAVLGRARDLDVLASRVDAAAAGRVGDARDAAGAEVAEALASARARRLMLDTVQWAATGGWRAGSGDPAPASRPARAFASETLDRLRRRVKRRGRLLATVGDEERHELRIAVKKLRYAAGFFQGLFPDRKAARRAKAFGAELERLQEALGELNDMATAPATLARLGLEQDAGGDPGRRAALIEEAAQAHDALMDAKRFWR